MSRTRQQVATQIDNQAPKNQGRQRKVFGDSPLFHFCLSQFYQLAKKWPAAKVSAVGVVIDKKDGTVAYGNPTLWQLFSIAVDPKQINPRQPNPLFLTCFKNSPDFTLALISRIRNQIAKCSPEKRAILFGIDSGKFSDREKEQRSELRRLMNQQIKAHETAYRRQLAGLKMTGKKKS
jgi:hypothetical protein